MLERRLQALHYFEQQPMPTWGADLSNLNIRDLHYYIKPVEQPQRTWQDVPEDIKATFDHLGVPQAERGYLAGLGAQYESEMVYHHLKQQWQEQGIIFLDTDSALKQYPDLFEQYFGTVVSYHDNKFAALNMATWSGGSFIYIPKGIKVTDPLQTYFRINAEQMGQFERTLIIVEENSSMHYIEGCTAPLYKTASLHSAVVEIIAKKNSRMRYSTIQNWSKNVYNLVTKRAVAHENAVVEWVDGNVGSGVTMKYPCVILQGQGSRAEIMSIAMASSAGQVQDSGGKVIHRAPQTRSRIIAKSMSSHGGRTSYRGIVYVDQQAHASVSVVQCDALMLDDQSRSDTYPIIKVNNKQSRVAHEASVRNIDDEAIFYMMSRGLDSVTARSMIVNGFIEPFTKELPLEFAVEMNRLIEHEMEGSIG
jgi:Fe-S cluster assembly protein SufB